MNIKKIFISLLIIIYTINGEILIITDKRELYQDIIKKFSSFFKKERIIISPSNVSSIGDFAPTLIFTFEKKFLNNLPPNFENVPIILFYIEEPLIPLRLNMTGIFYTPPASIIFSFLNSIGFTNKSVATIIPEGKSNFSYIEEAERISKNFNIFLKVLQIKLGGITEVIPELKKCDVIWFFPNEITLNSTFIKYMLRFSLEEKKVIIGYSRLLCEQGFVFSIEVNEDKYKEKIYELVKKIGEGRNPLAIPIQYPENFNYYYNVRIGKLLGINPDFSKFYKEIKYIEK